MPFRLSERTSNSKALSTICRFVLRRVSFLALRTKLSLMSMLVLIKGLYTIFRYFCASLREPDLFPTNCYTRGQFLPLIRATKVSCLSQRNGQNAEIAIRYPSVAKTPRRLNLIHVRSLCMLLISNALSFLARAQDTLAICHIEYDRGCHSTKLPNSWVSSVSTRILVAR